MAPAVGTIEMSGAVQASNPGDDFIHHSHTNVVPPELPSFHRQASYPFLTESVSL